jgi:DNA helicase HerA-like ATPase
MTRSPTFLGVVQDVQGATVSVALDRDTASGLAFIDGHGYRIGQVGSFVRVPLGLVDLFGVVSQVGAGAVPESVAQSEPYGHRWMRIQLVGEGLHKGEFRRGVSEYPTIGDEAHLVTNEDLARIYGASSAEMHVRVGSLASAESIPALLDINKLITRHSAVVGTTGAGKSTTVAGLVAAVSDPRRYPSARVIILEIHGEYAAALSDRATIFRVNADKDRSEKPLYVPYWALSLDELLRVTPFRGLGEADRAALVEKVRELKLDSLESQERPGVTPDTLTVDTPVPFSIHRLWYELHRLVCSTHTAQAASQSANTEAVLPGPDGAPMWGNIMRVSPPRYRPITQGGPDRVYLSAAPLNIRRQIQAMESRLRDSRYDFLFRPGPWCPEATLDNRSAQPKSDLDELLTSWIGNAKPITILDLSGVPVSILVELIGVLIRLLTDALFRGRYLPVGGRERPLLFVLEEAHTYLEPGSSGAAAAAVRRVVKEGRKYGVGAMIVSQRPSEIDPTVLSQCGTVVSMRLANAADRSHVVGSVSDHLEGLFSMLPALRTGEAIIVGEAVHLPLRAIIDPPAQNRRPDSNDPIVIARDASTGWNRAKQSEDYSEMQRRWRAEDARLATGGADGQDAG